MMGSGRTVEGKNTDFEHYLRYQRENDERGKCSKIYTHVFLVETKHIQTIKNKILGKDDSSSGYNCALFVSEVLTGVPPFESLAVTKYPSTLRKQLIEIQKNLWTKK